MDFVDMPVEDITIFQKQGHLFQVTLPETTNGQS